VSQQGSSGNVLAAICNIFIPGLGQLLQGRLWKAILFFILVAVGYSFYWLIFPAIFAFIFHVWAIISAARYNAPSSA
jgi:TM2 domain-containing membrane protein YozV